MEPVTGVFRSHETASEAAKALTLAGISSDHINVLLPGSSKQKVHAVPTSDTEQPGAVGGAFGGVLGGTLGMVTGFELGVAATALIPGVGPVIAVGLAGAALLGIGGAVTGAKVGAAADHQSSEGLPADEVYFYEDALRQGKSVVIAMTEDGDDMERAREVMKSCGAESLDAARDVWWLGLRDSEKERYRSTGRNFEDDQQAYRRGFEAALHPAVRGKSMAVTMDDLKNRYPDFWDTEAFRRGFERGQEYWAGQEWLEPVARH